MPLVVCQSRGPVNVNTMAFPVAGTLQLPGRCSHARSARACPPAPALRSAFLGERSGCLQARAFCGCQLQSGALSRRGGGSRTVTTMAAKGAPNAGPCCLCHRCSFPLRRGCLPACVALRPLAAAEGEMFAKQSSLLCLCKAQTVAKITAVSNAKSFKFTGDAVSSTYKGHPERRSL